MPCEGTPFELSCDLVSGANRGLESTFGVGLAEVAVAGVGIAVVVGGTRYLYNRAFGNS